MECTDTYISSVSVFTDNTDFGKILVIIVAQLGIEKAAGGQAIHCNDFNQQWYIDIAR